MILKSEKGQATTELFFILPIMIIMIMIVSTVVYLAHQSLKVQQAANYAARIQGQERIAGGLDSNEIDRENFGNQDADKDPLEEQESQRDKLTGRDSQGTSVYDQISRQVKSFFPRSEHTKIFVPRPDIGVNTDLVKVRKVIKLPKIFGHEKIITLSGEAYGGEDSHAYALPRWKDQWQTLQAVSFKRQAGGSSIDYSKDPRSGDIKDE